MLLTFMYGKISPVAIYVYYIKRNTLITIALASISILVREGGFTIYLYIYLFTTFFLFQRENKQINIYIIYKYQYEIKY